MKIFIADVRCKMDDDVGSAVAREPTLVRGGNVGQRSKKKRKSTFIYFECWVDEVLSKTMTSRFALRCTETGEVKSVRGLS